MTETTRIEGKVSLIPLKPSTIKISKKGIKKLIIAKVNVDVCETPIASTWPGKLSVSTTPTGIPIAPNAPDAALATKHNIAACNGLKPSCANKSAQIAIGTPNPAAPSKNALNEKPIKRSWILWSCEILVILSWIVANCPDFKVILYNNTAIITIYPIGKIPWKKPSTTAPEAIPTGNLKNGIAINNVTTRVVIAA